MRLEWAAEIDELNILAGKLSQLKIERLPPMPGATEEAITEAETYLGMALDPQYRSFLLLTNGWKDFCGIADLFGTDDLLGRTRLMSDALLNLVAFNPDGHFPPEEVSDGKQDRLDPALHFIRNEWLLPIGICAWYLSIILIGKCGTRCAGQVFHILGSGINRHADFRTFLNSRIQSERALLEAEHR